MMHDLKTETLTIRLCPATKAALSQIAEQEHRSLSNMLEVMIRDCSRRHSAVDSNGPDAHGRGNASQRARRRPGIH